MRSAMTMTAGPRRNGATVMLLVVLVGCGDGLAPAAGEEVRSSQARETSPVVSSDDAAALADGNIAFAVDLHRAVRGASGNMVSSPISVSLALAMLYGGARGTTADEIAAGLHFTLPPERLHPAFDALDLALRARPPDAGGFQLSIANAVWGGTSERFLSAYLDLLALNYGAGIRIVDFVGDADRARRSINEWVSQQTAAKVPDLLAPGTVDALTALVLTNAVYFRGEWETPFDDRPFDAAFHAPGGDVVVKMMHGASLLPIWNGVGYQAAALPYRGGATSMVVVVPDAGTFDAFEAGLTADGLGAVFAGRGVAPTGGVALPPFAFAGALDLVSVLQSMGVIQVFDGAADLSGINGLAGDLFVKTAVHKATITVDQKGTEAAAATGVVVGRKSASIVNLAIDRPFLFFIRHDATNAILFQGRVLDPTH
jgi:serpin B